MGSFTVNGVKIDLILTIKIVEDKVNMIIPLPENYPNTFLKTSKVLNEGLFTASLSIISSENSDWLEFLLNTRDSFGLVNGSGLALHSFYIIPRLYNLETTIEENIMLSGLGKRAICAAFPYIIHKLGLHPYNTIILLEASGGSISTSDDQARVNRYLFMGRDNIMNLYQFDYPGAFAEDYQNLITYSLMDLAHNLVGVENNQNLVNYYSQAYGFIPLSHPSDHTLMGTVLSQFIGHCQN